MGQTHRAAMFAAILLASAAASAQCTSAIRSVSQEFVFPNHAAGPAATNGAIIVVAKTDPTDAAVPLFVGSYDVNLSPTGVADQKVTSATLPGALALVSNGTDFALFYQAPNGQITMQRIDSSGNLAGTPLAVVPEHAPTTNQEFDVTFDAARNGYVLVHTITQGRDFGLWLTILNRDGSLQFDQAITFLFGDQTRPRVISAAGGRMGIAWVRLDDPNAAGIYFQIIDRSNQPVITQKLTSGTPRYGNFVLSTTPDGRYLMLYGAPPPAGPPPQPASIIWSISVTAGGVSAGASPFMSGRDSDDVAPIALTFNSSRSENALLYSYARFGFATTPPDLRLRRFTPSDIPSDTIFSPNAAISPFGTLWPLIWTGASYVDTITRPGGAPRSQGTDSYLVKHCPFLISIAADHATWLPLRDVTFTVSVSGGTSPFDFTWDFGDLTVGQHGAIVTHQYVRTGTYVVSVAGTDAAGARASAFITVNIVAAIGRHRAARK
jgi:hypothetical protein